MTPETHAAATSSSDERTPEPASPTPREIKSLWLETWDHQTEYSYFESVPTFTSSSVEMPLFDELEQMRLRITLWPRPEPRG